LPFWPSALAGFVESQGERAAHQLCQQPQTDWIGLCVVRGRQSRRLSRMRLQNANPPVDEDWIYWNWDDPRCSKLSPVRYEQRSHCPDDRPVRHQSVSVPSGQDIAVRAATPNGQPVGNYLYSYTANSWFEGSGLTMNGINHASLR